jgi:hypothetical protein
MLVSTADQHVTQNCTVWDNWETYTPTIKQNLMDFALSNMDALQVGDLGLFVWNRFDVDDNSNGFSGHGRLVQARLIIVRGRRCGHTNLVCRTVGFLLIRVMPM